MGTMVKIADPYRSEAEQALRAILGGAAVDDVESKTFDCKEDISTRDQRGERLAGSPEHEPAAKDLAEAAACFANSGGGAILVGINDKESGRDALVGAALDAEWLRKRIWELTDPSLTIHVQEVTETGGDGQPVRLLLLIVPHSPTLHRVDRRMKHRIRKDCVEMSPAEQLRAHEERQGYDWSAELTSHGFADVSEAAVERARTFLRDSGEPASEALSQADTPELLRRLGVVVDNDKLNRAGALMFVPPEGLDEVMVSYRRRPAPGADSTTHLNLKRPLLDAYYDIKQAIDAANDLVHLQLPSGVRPQVRRIPDAAVREAVVNGLIHRDYRLPGPVTIEFVGDQLIVDSPGGFVPGIDETNILSHPSKPRNAVLTRAFRALRLAEWEGVGVDRMYREMIRIGYSPPEIHDVGGRVRCVLLGGTPVEPVYQLTMALPNTARDDVDIALIIYELLDKAVISAAGLAPILQKGEGEALDALRRAEAVGVVVPTGRTRGLRSPQFRFSDSSRGVLGNRLSYITTSAEEAEIHVIRLLEEADQVSSRDLQEQLDVGSVQASRILAALRERGTIKLGSDHSVGRGVYYVRGDLYSERAEAVNADLT